MNISSFIRNMIPRVEIEEVAMFYKGTRLIPVCSMEELGPETPDAVAMYRRVIWFGSVIRCDCLEGPYDYLASEWYYNEQIKEKENQPQQR